MRGRVTVVLSLGLVAALLLSACGGDENGADSEPVGEGQVTEPADESPEGGDGSNGESVSLQLANFFGPEAAQSRALEWWIDEVEARSDGQIEVEMFYSEALIPLVDMLPGVAAGRADLGLGAHAYHPAELPLSQVVGIPFVTSNVHAQMATLNGMYDDYEPFGAEYRDSGVELLFWFATSPSTLGCPEPVTGIEDLEGKQIRGFGYVNEALEAVGAIGTAMSATEIYEGIERGLIDCYAGIPFDINADFGLHEVAPHIYDTGSGNFAANQFMMDKDRYDELPDELRDVIDSVSSELTEQWLGIYEEADADACATFEEAGVELGRLPEEDIEEWESAIGTSIIETFISEASDAGAPADEFFSTYEDRLAENEEGYDGYLPGIASCLD